MTDSPLLLSQTAGPRGAAPAPNRAEDPLWSAAQQLERSFLSEMLKSAGFGEARQAFGGGAGEEQFASFLRDVHTEKMVERGGIGLAESLYRALSEASDGP